MKNERMEDRGQGVSLFSKADVVKLLAMTANIKISKAELIVNKFVERNQQSKTNEERPNLTGPELISEKILYDLKDDEEVITNIQIRLEGDEYRKHLEGGIFSVEEVKSDPRVQELYKEVIEEVKTMESGPVLFETGDDFVELQGYFKNIRVVPFLDRVTGKPEKGFAIIGVKKNDDELVFEN